MKNWILILVLIALIVIAYIIYKNKKDKQNAADTLPVINNYYNNTTGSGSASNTGTGTGGNTSSNNTVVKIGDNVFAGPTGVNLYKTASIGTANILKYFAPFMKIGTYLATEGDFFKVTTANPNFGNGFDFTLYVTGYAKITQTTFK